MLWSYAAILSMVVLSDPSLIESVRYLYLKCLYFKHVLTVVARSMLGS